MAIYIVGDIQGCYSELEALLNQVNFNPKIDELWPAGDIVARGPDSLSTIRYIKSLGNSAKMVLGNHDLHLLSVYAGLKPANKKDLLTSLLNAPDIDELMDWLATQPLIRKLPSENAYLSHAGISPQWNIQTAIEHAEFAHQCLTSKDRSYWLENMYGEEPNSWSDVDLADKTQVFRFTINSFTRMRFCYPNGALDFEHKRAPHETTNTLIPWYQENPNLNGTTWVFGHWASLLGKTELKNVIALDTGCVWGNQLSMLRWDDKVILSEPYHSSS